MKKTLLLLLAGLVTLGACAAPAPETAVQTTAETAAKTAAPEPEPEPVEYTGREEVVVVFSETGTLERAGTVQTTALKKAEDLDPFAAYFSETDLAAAKALAEKDGETILTEAYLTDARQEFHLQSVTPESDYIAVACALLSPETEEGQEPAPEHGAHLFFVFHLDREITGGLPVRIDLIAE